MTTNKINRVPLIIPQAEALTDVICGDANIRKLVWITRNIDAWNIDALNIDAGNIDALDIDALDIDAENIDAWNIVALNIVAGNIVALNIVALNIDAENIVAKNIKLSLDGTLVAKSVRCETQKWVVGSARADGRMEWTLATE